MARAARLRIAFVGRRLHGTLTAQADASFAATSTCSSSQSRPLVAIFILVNFHTLEQFSPQLACQFYTRAGLGEAHLHSLRARALELRWKCGRA